MLALQHIVPVKRVCQGGVNEAAKQQLAQRLRHARVHQRQTQRFACARALHHTGGVCAQLGRVRLRKLHRHQHLSVARRL